MNNPFLKLSGTAYIPFSFEEKFATIFFTLGKYMQLMFFPHPLSHDYYPRAIEIMSFSDWQVWLSIILYLAMIVFIFKYWKKRQIDKLWFVILSIELVYCFKYCIPHRHQYEREVSVYALPWDFNLLGIPGHFKNQGHENGHWYSNIVYSGYGC